MPKAEWRFELIDVAKSDVERLGAQAQKRVLAKIARLRANFNAIVPEPLHGAYRGLFKLRVGMCHLFKSL